MRSLRADEGHSFDIEQKLCQSGGSVSSAAPSLFSDDKVNNTQIWASIKPIKGTIFNAALLRQKMESFFKFGFILKWAFFISTLYFIFSPTST
jgi:hypothetical protein